MIDTQFVNSLLLLLLLLFLPGMDLRNGKFLIHSMARTHSVIGLRSMNSHAKEATVGGMVVGCSTCGDTLVFTQFNSIKHALCFSTAEGKGILLYL